MQWVGLYTELPLCCPNHAHRHTLQGFSKVVARRSRCDKKAPGAKRPGHLASRNAMTDHATPRLAPEAAQNPRYAVNGHSPAAMAIMACGTAHSSTEPICQCAAAAARGVAFATATELGTCSSISRSLSASPNTTTSSSEMPSSRQMMSMPVALLYPTGTTFMNPAMGVLRPRRGTDASRRSISACVP